MKMGIGNLPKVDGFFGGGGNGLFFTFFNKSRGVLRIRQRIILLKAI